MSEVQETAEKADRMLLEMMTLNSEIEPYVWFAAMRKIMAESHHYSGVSYDDYKVSTLEETEFYKKYWE